jgi:SAM-dependent methyltransferase
MELATAQAALAASFRDPSGRLVALGERILRIVSDEQGAKDLEAFLNSNLAKQTVADGSLVPTSIVSGPEAQALLSRPELLRIVDGRTPRLVLEHEKIEFPSFPYEWAPEMLHRAGELTHDLAERALAEGFGLKDATPYNILFRGKDAVFVDLLSFEKRDPRDPTWLPYAQFIRTFLMPLMANRELGLSLAQTLGTHRDGIEPQEMYRLLGAWKRLFGPGLTLVSIPTWLGGGKSSASSGGKLYEKKLSDSPEKARFILESVLKSLRRALTSLAPKRAMSSKWSDYMESNNNYSEEHFRAKEAFVASALAEAKPERVLDVGCNTGHFSLLAAKTGARVVALDYDPVVVGEVWRRAVEAKASILPLAVNVAWPTPAIGWRNREHSGFLDRARGRFDVVLMLAVIHHMLVSERIPLGDILELAAELTKDVLVIELVAPEDSMFKRIARGREHLFADLNREVFEATAARHFEVLKMQHVEGTSRWLYALRRHKKGGAYTASA